MLRNEVLNEPISTFPPVLLIGFNRPEYLLRRLIELTNSSVKPEIVYISLDGCRNENDNNEIETFVSKVLEIKYNFQIKLIRRSSNLGCSRHIITAVGELLKSHHEIVVVEDDVVLGEKFYETMVNGLAKYQNIQGSGIVGAFSPFHKYPFIGNRLQKNYWRTSQYFSAWGWATSRDFWSHFEEFASIENIDKYLAQSLAWSSLTERKKKIWKSRFSRGIWDYNVQLILFKTSKTVLFPTLRLIDNEGFSDSRSTHTKHSRPWSLFGIGYSNSVPSLSRYQELPIVKIVWKMIDANLWAADGLFSTRARSKGVRTIMREILRSDSN